MSRNGILEGFFRKRNNYSIRNLLAWKMDYQSRKFFEKTPMNAILERFSQRVIDC